MSSESLTTFCRDACARCKNGWINAEPDPLFDRLRRSSRFRAELLVVVALLFAIGHLGFVAEFLGLSRHQFSDVAIALLLAILIYRFTYRMHRVKRGDIFTMQYHGWFRVAKELDAEDDVLLIRLYETQMTERPRALSRGELEEEERRGAGNVVFMSRKELESCEPKPFFTGELSDRDRELVDAHPAHSRLVTIHH